MKRTLTRTEMLNLWRTIHTAEPLRLDCVVTRADGPDFSTALEAEMRAWYLDLLDNGPEQMLAPVEMAHAATVAGELPGIVSVTLPAEVRRVLRVKFAGWGAPESPGWSPDRLLTLASNPYFNRQAVAAVSGNSLIVSGATGTLISAICVVDPGPERYVLDDKALALKT